MSFLRVFTLFATIIHWTNGFTNFDFIQDANGFSILWRNMTILEHSLESPILRAGIGNATFAENQGNFVITEEPTNWASLTMFRIQQNDPNSVTIQLYVYGSVIMVINETSINGLDALNLSVQVDPYSLWWNRLELKIVGDAQERIYGGGEQYSFLNLKGREYPIWTREQGVGRDKSLLITNIVEEGVPGSGGDYHTTYYPLPTYISTRNYAFLGEMSEYSVLNFTESDVTKIYVHSNSFAFNLIFADDFVDLVKTQVQLNSPSEVELPDWVYNGAIVAVEGGTDEMMDKLRMCQNAGVKVSAMWIQDWSGKVQTAFGYRVFWNWRWNSTLYPNLDTIIQQLAQETPSVRITAYMNPSLHQDGDIFKEAEQQGFLLKDSSNETYLQNFGQFLAGTVDLFNPQARQWYSGIIKENIIQLGLAGFMADFGEYTPLDSYTSSQNVAHQDPFKRHNEFPTLWANTVSNALLESNTTDVLPWARSGFLGAAKYHSIIWAGDQNVDWSVSDGLPSTIVAALSLGMSGYGLSHSDIGGYTTFDGIMVRSKELLLRWAEYSAFTPLMRTHVGNKPELNHQIYSDADTLQAFARTTRIFTTLAPYSREVVRNITAEHLPAMRPLFLHYPSPQNYEIQYQYLYGRDLLIAPVLKPRKESWSVYLPEDTWVYLWNNTIIDGPQQVAVDAPLGYPPVFYRFGSLWTDLFHQIALIP